MLVEVLDILVMVKKVPETFSIYPNDIYINPKFFQLPSLHAQELLRHKNSISFFQPSFTISSNFDLSIYSVYLQSLLEHITRTRTHPSLRVYVSMRVGEAHCSHTTVFSDISSIYIHPAHIHIRTCV